MDYRPVTGSFSTDDSPLSSGIQAVLDAPQGPFTQHAFPKLTYEDVMGDGVEIDNIHCSLLINPFCHAIMKGSQIGQA